MISHTVKPALLKRLPYRALRLAAWLGLLPAVALASPPQGEWRGLVQHANTDVSVTARFDAQVVRVHFDEPFSCEVPARRLKADGEATVYRFAVSTNGGRFCDGLLGHDFNVTPASNNHLKVVFDGVRNTWRGELNPPAATTP